MKRIFSKHPKADSDALHAVEQALYLRAVGFVQREEKTIIEDDGKGVVKEKREIVLKQVPPDNSCIMAWLREKSPGSWDEREKNAPTAIQVLTEAPRPQAPTADELPDKPSVKGADA